MVFTVTLNPAIDCTMVVDNYETGKVNRASKQILSAGGKGINVSRVLTELGVENTALGFAAGRTGDMFMEAVKEIGINSDFIRLDNGMTRINVKIDADTETEINGAGPEITMDDVNSLKNRLEAMNDGDTLVLAGSAPKSLGDGVYADILEGVKDKKINIVVDAEGELLLKTLQYHPFLIKPNIHELAAIFGKMPEGVEETQTLAGKLVEMGARNVLVSLGKDGAVLVNKNIKLFREAPAGKEVVNTTGSGDSMVAGFIAGFGDEGHVENGFRMGLAAGSASAFCYGLAKCDDILEIYRGMD